MADHMYKNLLKLFNFNERKKIVLLIIGMLLLAVVEVVGIASIIPFMSIIIDPNSVHTNTYLSELYNYFSFLIYFLVNVYHLQLSQEYL